MPLTTMTRADVIGLRDQLQKLLDANDPRGLQVHVGDARYDRAQATFKITLKIPGGVTLEDKAFLSACSIYGFDRHTPVQGKTLCGYKPSAPKYPWLVRHADGRVYKYTHEHARSLFSRALSRTA